MTLVAAQLSVSLDGCYAGPRDEDGGEVPWGADPPFRAPVFVVTSRPRETLQREGGTSFSYVTDGLASAVEQARAAAGDRNVAIAGGGSLVRQALAAGWSMSWNCTPPPSSWSTGCGCWTPASACPAWRASS
jgi:hypothetical protein